MTDLEKIVDQLGQLTTIETIELVQLLQEKWGVSAFNPMMIEEPTTVKVTEEKIEFDVILKDIGPKKIDVIKAIRQITSLGLKDAKEMAETTDVKIVEQISEEAAQDVKSKLETAGAVVELA